MSWAALILAGSRGPDDPVARAAGVDNKALALAGGRPMLEHVVLALRAVPAVTSITVIAEDPGLLARVPALRSLAEAGRVSALPAAASPSLSLSQALEAVGGGAPVLATTADNCLMTPAMVLHFLSALPAAADAAAAMARAEVIERAYPDVQRTYLRFRDGGFSGCNLFAFRMPAARRVLDFWRTVEADRKRPLAMARHLGPATLARYAAGRLTLGQALKALERRTGARLAVVDMPFAEAAIDVDKLSDLDLAEAILARRAVARGA